MVPLPKEPGFCACEHYTSKREISQPPRFGHVAATPVCYTGFRSKGERLSLSEKAKEEKS
jgi:hypothetical protein